MAVGCEQATGVTAAAGEPRFTHTHIVHRDAQHHADIAALALASQLHVQVYRSSCTSQQRRRHCVRSSADSIGGAERSH
jgi:hypothetical protein